MDGILIVLSRWIHVVSAIVAVGGIFFMRIVLPIAMKNLGDETQREVMLGIRRVFKRVVHTSILLLLLSGIYNTLQNWGTYKLDSKVMHGLWGMHMLLGLVAFAIALWLLAGATPKASAKKWLAINLGLLFVVVAFASTLKFARDRAVGTQTAPPVSASVVNR